MLLLTCLLFVLGFNEANGTTDTLQQHATDPESEFVILNEVKIEGNLKTRSRIILRELAMQPGDTIFAKDQAVRLQKDRNKIVNTNLFVTVEVALQKVDERRADLLIQVSERWYLFPMPIFELADRNFNEWWYERGRDLRRTHYGMRVSHKNFRGRNEQLDALIQFGFTRKFELAYELPYLDRIQKHGLNVKVSFSENKSTAYKTESHKLLFLKSENILRSRFNASIGISRRNRFYITHNAQLQYNYNQINDSIALLNPDFFLKGQTHQRYFALNYNFSRDLRDVVAYPLHGSRMTLNVTKLGLMPGDDINQLDIVASYTKYTPLGKKFYFNNMVQGKLSFPDQQPYANIRGLGYGQAFVRGYELYVIDGSSSVVSKSTLKRELFKTQKSIEKVMPLKQFQTVPLAMYVNLYFDMGYVKNGRANPERDFLSNSFLWGTGMGIDLVTFYNTVFRVDFSLNRSLEKKIFFHFVRDI
jgi:outer membrane protein assembly factor BamA